MRTACQDSLFVKILRVVHIKILQLIQTLLTTYVPLTINLYEQSLFETGPIRIFFTSCSYA
jgi:hypothetical protein